MNWDIIRDKLDDAIDALEAVKYESNQFGSLERDIYNTTDGIVLTINSFKELTWQLEKVDK